MDELMYPVGESAEHPQEKPKEMPEAACKCTLSQEEKVSVAVKVTPFATPCEAKVTCCGKPMVTCLAYGDTNFLRCTGRDRHCCCSVRHGKDKRL